MVKEKRPGIIEFAKGKEYQTVAYRVTQFRMAHPIDEGWAIKTVEQMYDETQVKYMAAIVDPTGNVVATGTAQEFWDANSFNRTSACEICETSAVGRALAFAGWGGEEIATADEILAAKAAQKRREEGFDGLEEELSDAGSPYEPPSMPTPAPDNNGVDILNALKTTAKANSTALAKALGEDVYAEWHIQALKSMCLVEDGSIDDVTSVDGLGMFIDGQKNKMKGLK